MMLTCLVLGFLAGGMLVIGVSFVGFWKSLSPSDFQAWFASYSYLIGRLMIPLGVSSVALTVAAIVVCWRGPARCRRWLLVAALSAVSVMITYPVFSPRRTKRSSVGAFRIQRSVSCLIGG